MNPAGLPGGSFGFPLRQALRPMHESRRLARRIVRFSATAGTPPNARIPPACPADRSVFRYGRHSAQRTNPAGLPGGSFGFPLRQASAQCTNPAGLPGGSFGFPLRQALRPMHESRRLARREWMSCSPKPNDPPGEPAGFHGQLPFGDVYNNEGPGECFTSHQIQLTRAAVYPPRVSPSHPGCEEV